MSLDLEKLANSLFNNQVPELWQAKAYPSLKPLSAWVKDLELRLEFITSWANMEPGQTPPVYWISGLFFPQAFLTGTLQNFARKQKIPVDTVSFEYQVISTPRKEIKEGPTDGCYIWGLYLEGARWDTESNLLSESKPKELFTEMAVIWLKPVQHRQKSTSLFYTCPVYKTLQRAGTLSTTGHSTNFVLSIELPSEEAQAHWIKRGVALICNLNY